jgi:hypothetical protein
VYSAPDGPHLPMIVLTGFAPEIGKGRLPRRLLCQDSLS